ncbi:MAG: diadenylate cyclase CdaA [Chloroflexota bacterium]
MIEQLTTSVYQLIYLFNSLAISNIVDIAAVGVVFFIVFQALHQTHTLQLLRGAIILAILGAAFLVLFPLNTLNWLVRGALLAGVIALPILFQDELRRVLVGLGQFGRRQGYGSDFERFKNALIVALEKLSSRQEGALIVLEGQTSLEDVVTTGISIQAEKLTAELLLTIFHPRTPLHDGAVILRGNRLVAAGCILPLATEKTGETHLGTRHRAALGLSGRVPDALVLVVSEETGRISVVQGGGITWGVSSQALESWLERFRNQVVSPSRFNWRWLRGGGWVASGLNLLMALCLAVVAWVSVIYQTNPPKQITLKEVPLVVTEPAQGLLLMTKPPETIRVKVQALETQVEQLSLSSVRAELPISSLTAGVHQVPVQVQFTEPRLQVVSIDPAFVDVLLEAQLSVEITPTVNVTDLGTLPLGYALGELSLSPGTLTVQGPKSLVEKVKQARITLSVEGQRSDFQRVLEPALLAEDGTPISGVRAIPETLLVTVPIKRASFSRQMAIRADLDLKSLTKDFTIKNVSLSPTSVTLLGAQSDLKSLGDFLLTAPIDLTGIEGEYALDVPLILPVDVSALDEQGESITDIHVKIVVEPVTDYLVVESKVVLLNVATSLSAVVTQTRVSVLVIGPRPLLEQIRLNPDLLSVTLDLEGYTAGTYTVPFAFKAPEGVQVQLFPAQIQVVLEEQAGG